MSNSAALEVLVAAVKDRLDAYAQSDPGPVLDPQAAIDARELLIRTVAARHGLQFDATSLVAWLHWNRSQEVPEDQGKDEAYIAAMLFAFIGQEHPGAVPEDLREHLATLGKYYGTEVQVITGVAFHLKQLATRDHDSFPLEQAIDLLSAAAAASDEAGRVEYLSDLGAMRFSLFTHSKQARDLDVAIGTFRKALAAAKDDEHRATILSNLGFAFFTRFERTAAAQDLDEAIRIGRKGVDICTDDHPRRATIYSNLARALNRRFELKAGGQDLDDVIRARRNAIAALEDHDAESLSDLGRALHWRFEYHGHQQDLDDAIQYLQEAVAAIDANEAHQGYYLTNLAVALHSRFNRTKDGSDLDDAIRVSSRAVAATPNSGIQRARYLANLSALLRVRYSRTRKQRDLAEAIQLGRDALTVTKPDDPAWPGYLTNLSGALRQRFKHSGDQNDLEEAIQLSRDAARVIGAHHRDHAEVMSDLAHALANRFERTRNAADLDEAVAAWALATGSPAAPVATRIDVALSWAETIARLIGPAAGVEAYTAAIELLSMMVWRGLSRRDRQLLLDTHANALACDAAACAIAAGRPDLAVELLEAGRGMYWSQILGTRTDLSDLEKVAPELAEELKSCRDVLERRTAASPGVDTAAADARTNAARRFDEVVAQVRDLRPTDTFPDPVNFMCPPPVAGLLPAVGQGPVAIINVSRWRCDALLLTHDGVTVIALPDLTNTEIAEEAIRYLEVLYEFERGRGGAAERLCLEMAITTTLEWLWDRVASPLLDAVGYRDTPTGQWPRLWWCPTGVLTLLPLHAAGYHDTLNTVLDRVVSSYTPSVRVLSHLRALPESTQAEKILIIALADTPGFGSLPGAELECELLTRRFSSGKTTVLRGADATRNKVLANLGRHRWLHASCHGVQDAYYPTNSGLLPHDWMTAGWVRVADLTNPHHAGGEFAFLSACKTAIGGIKNLDESLNLATAMHHAEWRHVIGTLWSVWDHSALAVAEGIYPELLKAGQLDARNAGRALHKTIRRLRDGNPHRPSIWAPFIHTGL